MSFNSLSFGLEVTEKLGSGVSFQVAEPFVGIGFVSFQKNTGKFPWWLCVACGCYLMQAWGTFNKIDATFNIPIFYVSAEKCSVLQQLQAIFKIICGP